MHLDLQGSPAAATNASGAVVWKEAYRPYGERILKQDGGSNNQWFTGKIHDEATGLSYFGARWYDPAIGRFMGVDPVGFDEDNIHSFNRFNYGNNNPYKYADPDGNAAQLILPLIGFGLLANEVATGDVPIVGGGVTKAAVNAGERAVAKSTVQANKAAGEAFEKQVVQEMKQTHTGVSTQVTVKTESGVRTKIDIMSRDVKGNVKCVECKASAKAPLTKNQKAAHPEIEQSGGTVVGKGKPDFPGGSKIPPTKVQVRRPDTGG